MNTINSFDPYKKINAGIFGILILFILISCKSTSVPKTVIDPAIQEDINKKTTAVANIAKLMASDNLEGAYYRMDGNFRYENSIEDFEENWKSLVSGKGSVVDFSVDSSEFQNLNYYKTLKVIYRMENGEEVTGRYLFNSATLVPMDVIFGASERVITDEAIPLKDLCKDYFKIGCGITGGNLQGSAIRVPEFMEVVKTQFSSCTSTNLMKPSYILNQNLSMKNASEGKNEPALDFVAIIPTLEWCMKNGVSVRGHTLVWHSQTPDWFFREDFRSGGEYVSREVMIERLDSYVNQYFSYVQTNFPGVVYCWDVVNEAVDPDKGDEASDFMCRIENSNGKNGWYMTIGPDYPEIAFMVARKYVADGVKLFYNDYGTISRRKSELIYNLCKSLAEKNLIDGIGMQGYWDLKNPSLKDIEEAINRYAELGLELQLTEWSIPVKAETPQEFDQQAERYASVVKLLQKLDTQGGGNANITCVSFFGVQDHYVLNPNDTTNTRLFDTNFDPKPVYYAISDIFKLYY